MAEDASDRVASFGRWLRRERELRGLAREDVVRLTRLPPGVVEALESGDAARMPPTAYVQGTLRSYAAAAGLDPDEAVLRWQEAAGTREKAPPVRRTSPARWVAVAAALALLAAALAGLVWSRGGR